MNDDFHDTQLSECVLLMFPLCPSVHIVVHARVMKEAPVMMWHWNWATKYDVDLLYKLELAFSQLIPPLEVSGYLYLLYLMTIKKKLFFYSHRD